MSLGFEFESCFYYDFGQAIKPLGTLVLSSIGCGYSLHQVVGQFNEITLGKCSAQCLGNNKWSLNVSYHSFTPQVEYEFRRAGTSSACDC